MKPTVSKYTTVIKDGVFPICLDTSSVANSRSSATAVASCVKACINEVLPAIPELFNN